MAAREMERQMASSDLAIRFARTSVNQVFPTLIWLADLEPDTCAWLNEALLARLDALTGPRLPSYPGETCQTESDLHQVAEFEPLRRAIEKVADGALRQLEVEPRDLVFTGMWANVNPPGASHSVHSHPNNFLTGIYYIQCDPKANVTRFYDPRLQADVIMPPPVKRNAFNGNLVQVEGKPGRLALFPAWLKHDVPINGSERERVTVSFNLMYPQFTERMSAPLWQGGKHKRLKFRA
jgi:uncharacterized protein (TIGR02466 family)